MKTLFRREPEAAPEPPPDPRPVPILDEATTAPCRCCGVAVHLSPDTPTESREFKATHPVTGALREHGGWTQTFARCAACWDVAAAAESIVAAHPALVRRLGPAVAGPTVEAALVSLAVLGQPLPVDPSAAEVARLLRHLSGPGAGVMWRERASLALGHALPYPYAHLEDEDRATLRRAYAAVLADRLADGAPPVRVVPPPLALGRDEQPVGTGCLLCGVGSVAVDRRDTAARPWAVRSAYADQIGARRSTRLRGHTCPACTEAVERDGALGPSAVERALYVHLDLAHLNHAPWLSGPLAWGALTADARRRGEPDPQPNGTPWAHLGDLAALRERIVSEPGVG